MVERQNIESVFLKRLLSPFIIVTAKRYSNESTVVSFRLPKDMLRDVDKVAEATGRTRNEIMTTSLEFALRHMEIALSPEKSES